MVKAIIGALALSLMLGAVAVADTTPRPAADRTVEFCSDMLGATVRQRNSGADDVVKLQAQLAMTQRDLAAANARIAQLTSKPAK